jgi:hypothetical protein
MQNNLWKIIGNHLSTRSPIELKHNFKCLNTELLRIFIVVIKSVHKKGGYEVNGKGTLCTDG